MAVQKILLNKIMGMMSLNSYEAKVYMSLLSRGISSAGELAEISGVPRSRCYDILESLEKKGFVFQKIGKPIKYISVPPEEVVDKLKKQARIEENRLITLFDSIKETDVFSELQEIYNTGINYIEGSKISHSIVGKNNINLFMKEMLGRASKNIVIHTTEEGLKRKLKLLKKSANRKADITINAPVKKIKGIGQNTLLNTSQNKARFVRVDNDEMLFFTSPEDADPDHETAVWIKSRFAVDALRNFLE